MIEVSKNQLSALMRGEAVTVGPSKRVITLKDGPFTVKHYGPGPHPGTGTPQSVHGGGSVQPSISTGGQSAHELFHVPRTQRWDGVRDGLDAIDQVLTLYGVEELPMKESKATMTGGAYRILTNGQPSRFFLKVYDGYGYNSTETVVHEIGHHIDHWLLAETPPYGTNWLMDAAAKIHGEGYMAKSERDRMAHLDSQVLWMMTKNHEDLPENSVMDSAVKLWDEIVGSVTYRTLAEYSPGRLEKELPIGYFEGERSSPVHMVTTEGITGIMDYSAQATQQLMRPREVFARAFVQYVGLKSGNEAILRSIEEQNKLKDAGFYPRTWDWDEFEPIADAMDNIFRKKQWLIE